MKGYTKEAIKRILGSSWPTIDPDHETGNEMRKRKGREMRAGLRPYPVYNAKKLVLTLMRMESIFTPKDQGLDILTISGTILIVQKQVATVIRYHKWN